MNSMIMNNILNPPFMTYNNIPINSKKSKCPCLCNCIGNKWKKVLKEEKKIHDNIKKYIPFEQYESESLEFQEISPIDLSEMINLYNEILILSNKSTDAVINTVNYINNNGIYYDNKQNTFVIGDKLENKILEIPKFQEWKLSQKIFYPTDNLINLVNILKERINILIDYINKLVDISKDLNFKPLQEIENEIMSELKKATQTGGNLNETYQKVLYIKDKLEILRNGFDNENYLKEHTKFNKLDDAIDELSKMRTKIENLNINKESVIDLKYFNIDNSKEITNGVNTEIIIDNFLIDPSMKQVAINISTNTILLEKIKICDEMISEINENINIINNKKDSLNKIRYVMDIKYDINNDFTTIDESQLNIIDKLNDDRKEIKYEEDKYRKIVEIENAYKKDKILHDNLVIIYKDTLLQNRQIRRELKINEINIPITAWKVPEKIPSQKFSKEIQKVKDIVERSAFETIKAYNSSDLGRKLLEYKELEYNLLNLERELLNDKNITNEKIDNIKTRISEIKIPYIDINKEILLLIFNKLKEKLEVLNLSLSNNYAKINGIKPMVLLEVPALSSIDINSKWYLQKGGDKVDEIIKNVNYLNILYLEVLKNIQNLIIKISELKRIMQKYVTLNAEILFENQNSIYHIFYVMTCINEINNDIIQSSMKSTINRTVSPMGTSRQIIRIPSESQPQKIIFRLDTILKYKDIISRLDIIREISNPLLVTTIDRMIVFGNYLKSNLSPNKSIIIDTTKRSFIDLVTFLHLSQS